MCLSAPADGFRFSRGHCCRSASAFAATQNTKYCLSDTGVHIGLRKRRGVTENTLPMLLLLLHCCRYIHKIHQCVPCSRNFQSETATELQLQRTRTFTGVLLHFAVESTKSTPTTRLLSLNRQGVSRRLCRASCSWPGHLDCWYQNPKMAIMCMLATKMK